MIFLRLSILFAVCHGLLEIKGCGENHKQCFKYPADCVGNHCLYIYSAVIEGDSMEVEIVADLEDNHSYATAIYSFNGYPVNNTKIDNRLVCHRDSTIVHMENTNRTSNETTDQLEVTLLEVIPKDTWIHCKFRHSAEFLKDIRPTVYMARGVNSPFDNWSWTALGAIDWDDKEPKVIISERKWEKLMDRLEAVEEATNKILDAIESWKSTPSLNSFNDQAKAQNDIKVESNIISDKKPSSHDYNIMIQLGLPNRYSK